MSVWVYVVCVCRLVAKSTTWQNKAQDRENMRANVRKMEGKEWKIKVSEGEGDWQARRGWDHSLTAPCSNYNILCWVCVLCVWMFFVCVTLCICISGPVQGILDSMFARWIMHQSPFFQPEIALCSKPVFYCHFPVREFFNFSAALLYCLRGHSVNSNFGSCHFHLFISKCYAPAFGR